MRDAAAISGWSYSGAAVPLESAQIFNFLPNARVSSYAPGTNARFTAEQFYAAYQNLLVCLNGVINGCPQQMGEALGLMHQLKLLAAQVARNPANSQQPDLIAAPPFMF